MKKTYLFVLNATGMSQAQVSDISAWNLKSTALFISNL